MDREVMRIRDSLSAEFSRLCYYGFWYAPEMELVMNSIEFSQKSVTGAVEMKLYKGIFLPFPPPTHPHPSIYFRPPLSTHTPHSLTTIVTTQAMRSLWVANLLVLSTVLT